MSAAEALDLSEVASLALGFMAAHELLADMGSRCGDGDNCTYMQLAKRARQAWKESRE